MNQMIMTAKLEKFDAAVTTVAVQTAEEALECFEQRQADGASFDLILMDQHFESAGGVMTGEQATTELRSRGHAVPIIMCTGNCAESDKARYFRSGASLVWPKPYPDLPRMMRDVSGLVGGGRAAASYR